MFLATLNTWEPGEFGWTVVETGEPQPEPTGPEPWEPYYGTPGSLYQTGDRATHNGATWESLVDNNSWEPEAPGNDALWAQVP